MQNTDKAAATTWAKNYENAKSVFADYKHLKTKTLLKELNADKADIRDLGKTIVKNIATMDESYNLLMPKLNPEVRNKVEALVVKEIASLNTRGVYDPDIPTQAVDWRQLSHELNRLNELDKFTNPEVKKLFKSANNFAKVFRDDVSLWQGRGFVNPRTDAHYLTTDPKQRLSYHFASRLFQRIKALGFSNSAEELALLFSIRSAVQEPLLAKPISNLLDYVPNSGKSEVRNMIDDYNKIIAGKNYNNANKSGQRTNEQPKENPNELTVEETQLAQVDDIPKDETLIRKVLQIPRSKTPEIAKDTTDLSNVDSYTGKPSQYNNATKPEVKPESKTSKTK